MKLSCLIDPGIYEYVFTEDKIAVVRHDKEPEHTMDWVKILPYNHTGRYFLRGNDSSDICVVCTDD